MTTKLPLFLCVFWIFAGWLTAQDKVQFEDVVSSLEDYYEAYIMYPENLDVLVKQGFLKEGLQYDEFSRKYEYKAFESALLSYIKFQDYKLFSVGLDGKSDTGDDIVLTAEKRKAILALREKDKKSGVITNGENLNGELKLTKVEEQNKELTGIIKFSYTDKKRMIMKNETYYLKIGEVKFINNIPVKLFGLGLKGAVLEIKNKIYFLAAGGKGISF